jgi:3-phenylpropionate/trans-cinnamate dioxygenase ferredoxin reductase subunit
MRTRDQAFVIVGASLAGAKAAETLREKGFDGRVVLVGAEPERPYDRPPLSKSYLRGETGRDKVYVHDESFYGTHDIELRFGTTAVSLDVAGRALALDDGSRLRFDRLLLATGAEPRKLKIPGADLRGVHYLRTIADADALRQRLDDGGKMVVIGAGWIGAEVAASARQRGVDVTVVAPTSVPLAHVLGPELGAFYRDIHVEAGVELILGSRVAALEGESAVERVHTSDGRVIACDVVVVGVGVAPRTALAAGAGLKIDNGIVVDERLQTSAPGIFAAGDVANHRHPIYGALRVEHWANALNQGAAAACNMLGQDRPYDAVPYFFSDQYDIGMEYSGTARRSDQVPFRGEPASRKFIVFWLRKGRVTAGMNVNVWDVSAHIQALIHAGAVIDRRRLSDPAIPLEDLVGHVPQPVGTEGS